MQDRYLFCGKRVENSEWVEGFFYIVTKGAHLDPIQNGCYITTFKRLENGEIILTGCFEVDPATLRQCTGLPDKNDKLIYDGNIIEYDDDIGVVDFNEACFNLTIGNITTQLSEFYARELEIIGNIHDNPELLRVSDSDTKGANNHGG